MKKNKLLSSTGQMLKVLSIAFVMLFSVAAAKAQVNIPDATLKGYLNSIVADDDGDNTEVSVTEAAAYAGAINVSNLGITDMTGIEAFTGVTSLDCSGNSISVGIDLSPIGGLGSVNCSGNSIPSLDVHGLNNLLTINCSNNSLTSINLLGCTSLQSLDCSNNSLTVLDDITSALFTYLNCSGNSLSTLNLGANTGNLKNLNYANNTVTSLDLTLIPGLLTLNCGSNGLSSLPTGINTGITSLNYSGNTITNANLSAFTGLTTLNCSSNGLSALPAGTSTGLKNLDCHDNPFGTLALSTFTALDTLNCSSDNLTKLNVYVNSMLLNLNCSANKLDTLSVANNTLLNDLDCSSNRLTSLNVKNGNDANFNILNATLNPNLACVVVDDENDARNGNYNNFNIDDLNNNSSNPHPLDDNIVYNSTACQISCVVNITDADFKTYLTGAGVDANNDNIITCAEAAAVTVTSIDISSVSTITDLSGIDKFTALTSLNISNNTIISSTITPANTVTSLTCANSGLTSLDVSALTNLKSLDCSNNSLTALSLTGLSALETLDCNHNTIASLPLTGLTALKTIDCSNNSLASLTVTGLTNLTSISADNNSLTTLSVSTLPKLTSLSCKSNSLASLTVASFPMLLELYTSFNSLTSLTLSDLPALLLLKCDNNSLASIDVSSFTTLQNLDCSSNSLSAINVGNATGLTTLNVSDNTAVTTLDLSNNLALETLKCANNTLTSLDVSANTALTSLECFNSNLHRLNVKNGGAGTGTLTSLNATNNPALTCIVVNDVTYATNNYIITSTPASFNATSCPLPKTWDGGAGTANWDDAANWSNDAVPGDYDDVSIDHTTKTGAYAVNIGTDAKANSLTITDADITLNIASAKSLTANSISTGLATVDVADNASIVQVAAGASISGTAYTIHRNKTNSIDKYNFWSSPVTAGNTSMLPSAQHLYRITPGYGLGTGSNFEPWSGAMEAGRGYTATNVASAAFTGTPNTGNVTYSLQRDVTYSSNTNLVGNPYPSAINALSFVNANTGSLTSATVYLWNQSQNGLTTLNPTLNFIAVNVVGTSGLYTAQTLSNTNIASCQGFEVAASSNGASLLFTNAMRNTNNGSFYKTGKSNVINAERVWLSVEDGSSISSALIALSDSATAGKDFYYDAPVGQSSSLQITSVIDSATFGIQSLPANLVANTEVPLAVSVAKAGTVTFTLAKEDNVKAGRYIYLLDKEDNTYADLRQGAKNIAFGSAAKINDRFALVFTNNSVATGISEATATGNWSLKHNANGALVIKLNDANDYQSYEVYDLAGKLLAQSKVNNLTEIVLPTETSGLLLVRMIRTDGTSESKKGSVIN